MQGAYCLHCEGEGPDMVIHPEDAAQVPIGVTASLTFTCGRCQQRWHWAAIHTHTGFVYLPLGKASDDET